MKKITFNAPLNHKAYSYEPMKIEVEKVITLYGKRFEQMRDHPLEDAPEIIENRDLMYMEGNTAHCILFLDANGSDGILVEAEGSDYARKSQFISNARAIIEANDITAGEQQLHQEMKKMADKIAGLAHRGEHHIYFGNLHESEIIKSLIVKSVAEMLSQRSDIADVKNHYPNIPFQPDYTVTPKPTQHPLIAVGICLSANEVPRIAQMFGLDTSVRVNMMSINSTVSMGAKAAKFIAKK